MRCVAYIIIIIINIIINNYIDGKILEIVRKNMKFSGKTIISAPHHYNYSMYQLPMVD